MSKNIDRPQPLIFLPPPRGRMKERGTFQVTVRPVKLTGPTAYAKGNQGNRLKSGLILNPRVAVFVFLVGVFAAALTMAALIAASSGSHPRP